MKPVIGCAPSIIQSAMDLKILCRPVEIGWNGVALEPTGDAFYRMEGDLGYTGIFSPSPGQLCLDWQLTTLDLIKRESATPEDF